MKTLYLFAFAIFANLSLAASNVWEGQPFAQFSLRDQTGKLKSNADFLGHWTVIYFYPKDKTPGCTVEAQNFTQDFKKYQKLGVNIVGVSYDDVESHRDFAETYEMTLTLLADVDHRLGKAMKVDRFLPWPHTSRETFVVNPEGFIVKHYGKVSPQTHSDDLLARLPLLQQGK